MNAYPDIMGGVVAGEAIPAGHGIGVSRVDGKVYALREDLVYIGRVTTDVAEDTVLFIYHPMGKGPRWLTKEQLKLVLMDSMFYE